MRLRDARGWGRGASPLYLSPSLSPPLLDPVVLIMQAHDLAGHHQEAKAGLGMRGEGAPGERKRGRK